MPAVAVATPAAAAAVSGCVPTITVVPEGSSKCCNGQPKNMKVQFKITDTSNCLSSTASICITDVKPDIGNPTVGDIVWVNDDNCGVEGESVTAYLLDVSACTVNLLVYYTVDGVDAPMPISVKSDNIPSGNTDAACVPPTTTTTTTAVGTTTTTTTAATTTTTTTAPAAP